MLDNTTPYDAPLPSETEDAYADRIVWDCCTFW